MEGLLIVVSGPSAAGKGTVCRELLNCQPDLVFSVSATTRPPRPGEVDGKNYYFISREEFERMVAAGEMLEWAEVYGNFYGTPRKAVVEWLDQGRDVLLEIDIQGARQVRRQFPRGVFIFLMPPSLAELERRIRERGTETEEAVQRRLASAAAEIAACREYDYVVVNDRVEDAVAKIRAIITAEKCRVERNKELYHHICGEEERG
ncbi:MAG: guanylate kinase [Eubacteriales bacterium]|nr:guanylate kinase [Eubacteriales bacterium]MDN5363656.1 guanylate kinase [Eubacteriales bacterium]